MNIKMIPTHLIHFLCATLQKIICRFLPQPPVTVKIKLGLNDHIVTRRKEYQVYIGIQIDKSCYRQPLNLRLEKDEFDMVLMQMKYPKYRYVYTRPEKMEEAKLKMTTAEQRLEEIVQLIDPRLLSIGALKAVLREVHKENVHALYDHKHPFNAQKILARFPYFLERMPVPPFSFATWFNFLKSRCKNILRPLL